MTQGDMVPVASPSIPRLEVDALRVILDSEGGETTALAIVDYKTSTEEGSDAERRSRAPRRPAGCLRGDQVTVEQRAGCFGVAGIGYVNAHRHGDSQSSAALSVRHGAACPLRRSLTGNTGGAAVRFTARHTESFGSTGL
jgi:hypothetical protein